MESGGSSQPESGTSVSVGEPALDLGQFLVDPLQGRGALDQDVHLDVIADRHLVEQAAELGLHQGEALRQPVAQGDEITLRGMLGLARRRLLVHDGCQPPGHYGIETEFGELFCCVTYFEPVAFESLLFAFEPFPVVPLVPVE